MILFQKKKKKNRSVIEVTHWLVEQVSCHESYLVGFIRTGMIGFINLDLPDIVYSF